MLRAGKVGTPGEMRLNRLAFGNTNRKQRQAHGALHFGVGGAAPVERASVLQWTIAAAVALALGLYLVVAISWRPDWAPFFTLAALFPFLAMIVRDVRRLLLAVVLVEISVPLDISLLTDWSANSLGAIGGLYVSVTTFCLVALYALWAVELLAKVTPIRRSWCRPILPLITYLAGAALSVVVARALNLFLFELFLLAQAFLIAVYIIKTVRSRQDVLFILTILLFGLAFQGAVMIGLRMVGHSIYAARISARIDAGGRVGGTIGSPNTAASYLTLLLAPALSVLVTPLKRRYKALAALSFGLGGVALLLTGSRGGWIGCALSVAILCLLALQRGWLSPKVVLTIAAVAALLSLFFGAAVLDRLTGDDAGAAASRLPLARIALRVIRDHPILGVGANNYTTVLEAYVTAEVLGEYLYTVHNKYLLVWAETGIVGLVAFLGFLLAHIRRGWQVWKWKDHLLSPVALALAAAIAGQMVHMFFDVFHSRPQVQMLWLVAGIITAIHTIDGSGR